MVACSCKHEDLYKILTEDKVRVILYRACSALNLGPLLISSVHLLLYNNDDYDDPKMLACSAF